MFLIFLAEIIHRGEHRVRRGLAQSAERADFNGFGGLLQQFQRLRIGFAVNDIIQHRQHLAGAFAAWNTLAAGFILRELHEKSGDAHHAGLVVHHHQPAGTDHGADVFQRIKVQRHIQHGWGQAAAGRAADLHGFEIFAGHFAVIVNHSAADMVDNLSEGGAERHFDKAGIGDVTGERKSFSAGRVGRSHGAIFFRAFPDDGRHGGQSFNVVDDSRLAPQSFHGRVGRLRHGHAALAFNRGQQCGFFAADERSGAFHHVQFEVEFRAEQVIAEQSDRRRGIHGAADALHRQGIFRPDVHIAFIRADRFGGDEHAFNHAVRVAFHDGTVHKRAGIAFIAVADDVFFAVFRSQRDLPLSAGGKAAAAASAQSGVQYFLTDVLTGHGGNRSARRVVAAAMNVFRDAVRFNHTIFQHHPALPVVKSYFLIALAAHPGDRIKIQQAFNQFSFNECSRDNFRDVADFDSGIEDAGRFNMQQRPHLAEALAAASGNVMNVVIVFMRGKLQFHIQTGGFQFLCQRLAHSQRAIGHAAGPGAKDDPAFYRRGSRGISGRCFLKIYCFNFIIHGCFPYS